MESAATWSISNGVACTWGGGHSSAGSEWWVKESPGVGLQSGNQLFKLHRKLNSNYFLVNEFSEQSTRLLYHRRLHKELNGPRPFRAWNYLHCTLTSLAHFVIFMQMPNRDDIYSFSQVDQTSESSGTAKRFEKLLSKTHSPCLRLFRSERFVALLSIFRDSLLWWLSL